MCLSHNTIITEWTVHTHFGLAKYQVHIKIQYIPCSYPIPVFPKRQDLVKGNQVFINNLHTNSNIMRMPKIVVFTQMFWYGYHS